MWVCESLSAGFCIGNGRRWVDGRLVGGWCRVSPQGSRSTARLRVECINLAASNARVCALNIQTAGNALRYVCVLKVGREEFPNQDSFRTEPFLTFIECYVFISSCTIASWCAYILIALHFYIVLYVDWSNMGNVRYIFSCFARVCNSVYLNHFSCIYWFLCKCVVHLEYKTQFPLWTLQCIVSSTIVS